MKEFDPMKAVYSYYFPETREIVKDMDYPSEIFLTQTQNNFANETIEKFKYKKGFYIPQTEQGKVDLDSLHEPVIEAIIEEYKEIIPGLSDFKYRYPTSGSSEGIFHFLAYLKSSGERKIKTLNGEYEGYKEYGKTLGLETVEYADFKEHMTNEGLWFISNPSARDGNIISQERIDELLERGNKVALDLAYVGSTLISTFDVSHPNIETVFLSFSKPYGLFRFRIGFTFSRNEIPSLYANKWFKSIPSLLLALKVVNEIGPRKLPEKYKVIQAKIVDEINNQTGLNMNSSEVLLLGNICPHGFEQLDDQLKKLIEPYRRGENFRFCLTPYFERQEKGGEKK